MSPPPAPRFMQAINRTFYIFSGDTFLALAFLPHPQSSHPLPPTIPPPVSRTHALATLATFSTSLQVINRTFSVDTLRSQHSSIHPTNNGMSYPFKLPLALPCQQCSRSRHLLPFHAGYKQHILG